MRESSSIVIRREDYVAPAFWIRTVNLTLDLDPAKTLVINTMEVEPNVQQPNQALRLSGVDLTLMRLLINGESVSFRRENETLVIDSVPKTRFMIEIRNTCTPEKNTQLIGLYTSNGGLFTQCEAEGFRRITYFMDRPDIMSVYTVTLRAHKATYPVLLCNGNLLEQGDLENGRHFAKWLDPHPKPCYLFALVAADLVSREQPIRSRSGRNHLLQIYVRKGDLGKTEHAMNSLIASIIWDEWRFGLALDLERFMIVAVSDFNMGAMENKGLNIFNSRYVLASPTTATDQDYAAIESVVGHEYFHNWTGNRVTCRDWFQLSLKEGLTVFRDQEFSMDMAGSLSARAVKRIEDVRQLRHIQFSEDASTMAHPVRPDEYVAINNFYTATVYEKGAELVRMMQTLVGKEGFIQGMQLYFSRHDGQAVTCDDFVEAIAAANPRSALANYLTPFKRWYSQAGTPRLSAKGRFDAPSRTYTLLLEQHAPQGAALGDSEPLPFVIPVTMGLLNSQGEAMPLHLENMPTSTAVGALTRVLVVTEKRNFYTFSQVDQEPIPSLLRGFSAPVILQDGLNETALLLLLQHDSDPFNRWEAGQRLALSHLLKALGEPQTRPLDLAYIEALSVILQHSQLDPAFKELTLTLPSESYIAEQLLEVDPQDIHRVRQNMRQQLAQELFDQWLSCWQAHSNTNPYTPDAASAGRRALANLALSMLCLHSATLGDDTWTQLALTRAQQAQSMTDCIGAIQALLGCHSLLASQALEHFYQRYAHEPLVLDKWFTLQACAPERSGAVFERVLSLLHHPDFTLNNPNRARSLLVAFCANNPGAFHRPDGAGYQFWADYVLKLDDRNPQLAARLARALDQWLQLASPYKKQAQLALERVGEQTTLSSDVQEIIVRALKRS